MIKVDTDDPVLQRFPIPGSREGHVGPLFREFRSSLIGISGGGCLGDSDAASQSVLPYPVVQPTPVNSAMSNYRVCPRLLTCMSVLRTAAARLLCLIRASVTDDARFFAALEMALCEH
ncbi:hypothetical protein G3480_11395 [Thiorhodococcus mannitoliphagus]|uniref:Uncharacterized protein n=1 Tax=Thiorhodococcus mannitoliphagus TaxID=329406 RepID=A0A6P1DTX8_9GAMM|nr:hypothetical protein [Thiorhodococcus mannitoliphagus]NEX20910.1 hypothetical protein [Thiorhodococcus mannitoliphagus]